MSADRAQPDATLTALLKADDPAAFTGIYDRYSGVLYIYAFKLTGSEDDARDLVQEVFVSLWERRAKLELRGQLSSYLYSAVRFQFLKNVEKAKTRNRYAAAFLAEFGEALAADDYIGEKELTELVEQYLRHLPPQMARVFTLSRLQQHTNEEIAAELGISEKTVRNLLSESARQLKPKLGLSVLIALLPYF